VRHKEKKNALEQCYGIVTLDGAGYSKLTQKLGVPSWLQTPVWLLVGIAFWGWNEHILQCRLYPAKDSILYCFPSLYMTSAAHLAEAMIFAIKVSVTCWVPQATPGHPLFDLSHSWWGQKRLYIATQGSQQYFWGIIPLWRQDLCNRIGCNLFVQSGGVIKHQRLVPIDLFSLHRSAVVWLS